MVITDPWIMLLLSAVASLLLCILLTPVARRYNVVDHPCGRKVHDTAIPLVGGIATYLVFVVMTLLVTPYGKEAIPLLSVCGLMMVTGIVDDRHELSPRTRFILQIIACCIMIFAGGVMLTDFGKLMWNGLFLLGWFSIPVTIFSALGVINAFNMVDGMDGLSSMIFIIACSAMAWLALQAGLVFNATMLLIGVGAVFGYFLLNARLPWNVSARVFLGDSGSLFLGMLLAWQFIDLGNGEIRAYAPMTAVWLLGIPLIDTTRLMTQRWRSGGSSMQADQFHLHHAFLKAGFSVRQTWFAILCLVLFTTIVGLAGHIYRVPDYIMFYTYMVFCLVYLKIMHRCWHEGRFLGRSVAAELN